MTRVSNNLFTTFTLIERFSYPSACLISETCTAEHRSSPGGYLHSHWGQVAHYSSKSALTPLTVCAARQYEPSNIAALEIKSLPKKIIKIQEQKSLKRKGEKIRLKNDVAAPSLFNSIRNGIKTHLIRLRCQIDEASGNTWPRSRPQR